MSKNTQIGELINYISVDGSGNVVLSSGQLVATQNYVSTAITNLVNSAPSTLDTLNELATALGNDANFATTVATSIGTKQAQLNGTGFVKISGTTISYDNSTYLTTATASSTYLTTTTAGTTYVPYTGGTANVNLGVYDLDGGNININGGGSGGGALRLKQYGSSEANREGYNSISTLTSGVFYFTSSASVPNFKNFVLNPSGLTDNTTRTYALPDASGTLALTSNLSSYLPLAGGTLSGRLNGIVGGTAYNTAGLWLQGSSSTDGIAIGGTGGGDKTIDTYGGTLRLNGTAENGLYVGGAATFSSSIRAATLNLNTSPLSDRLLYISALLPTTGTSQFQAVVNGTFVNAATTLYGVYIGNNSNVNVTNSYALFLESTGGTGTITNKYGIYQSGSSDKNYFAGSTGVGTNNPSSIFHVIVPESASNLSGVRIQGDTNSKLLVLGANATYTWIQSHGSVPLRLNELGNELIMGLGSNVGIGTSTITDKLEVRGADNGITISSVIANRPVLKFVNGTTTMLKLSANGNYGAIADNTGNDVVFFRNGNVSIGTTTESSGYQFTVAKTARFNGMMLGNGDGSNAADNRIAINWDSGSKAYLLAQQNVPLELGNNNTTKMTIGTDGYVSVTGGMKTDGTVSIGSSVGLLQFAMDGTRFNSYGFSHVHIKTSILKGSDTMISFNIRGYYYSPNTIDTDIAFYNYNPVSYVYSPTAHVKAYGGITITLYYSSDNYVCICVEGLSTYGGFALNWINTSLIQWGGRVFTLAWSKANTASAQY